MMTTITRQTASALFLRHCLSLDHMDGLSREFLVKKETRQYMRLPCVVYGLQSKIHHVSAPDSRIRFDAFDIRAGL